MIQWKPFERLEAKGAGLGWAEWGRQRDPRCIDWAPTQAPTLKHKVQPGNNREVSYVPDLSPTPFSSTSHPPPPQPKTVSLLRAMKVVTTAA
ncbi:Hypothetical protein NTJ_02253 [Nesidiocoris tenuis]|uniref:Uncharacterized protein n=1 Tax=Nesidiocoris tenuis TaxID=355587 RepID=A0ABN7AE48_9HEMI|nr:Hypothetical protein NTJ_02253 [Nesidiocoris tenuis]